MSQQGPHFSPHSIAKANYKVQISGKLVTNGFSDVAIDSVHSEKIRPYIEDDYDNYIYYNRKTIY